MGLFEKGFGVFDQADPFGDLGDPDLSEVELLSVGTSSWAEMGVKRKPPTSLFDLLEGQPGKGVQGKSQSNVPTPPPQPHLSKLGLLLPDRSHNLPDQNFLPLPNPLCLLGLSPSTQRGRGVPRVRSQWTGGNLTPLERRTKPRELKNS